MTKGFWGYLRAVIERLMVLGYNQSMNRLFLITLLLVLSPSLVSAIDYQWTGLGANALWTTPENWSPNGVPGPIDRVIFDSGSIASSMDRDFSILRLETTSGYSGDLSFGAFNLNINEQFDVSSYGGTVSTDSLILVFVGPSSILSFEGSLELKGISTIGHTVRGNIDGTTADDTLIVTGSFVNSGQVDVEEVIWFQSGDTFDNTGTIVALTDEERLHLELGAIQNLGVLDIHAEYSALSNLIAPGQYQRDLVLSTRGAVDTVSFVFPTGNYQIGGDLDFVVDSLFDFPLFLRADSSTVINLEGSWNSYTQSVSSFSKFTLFWEDAQMTLAGDLSLRSLDSTHDRFFSEGGLLTFVGGSGQISLDSRNTASFANIEIQDSRQLVQGEMVIFGNATQFEIDVGASLEVSSLAGVTVTRTTAVNILGDMRGEGLLTLVTDSSIVFPDTLRIATLWSEYVYNVPGIVYTRPFRAMLDSDLRQMVYRFFDTSYDFQGGLEFVYEESSIVKHILDFATADPQVKISGSLRFIDNNPNLNIIVVWSDIPLEFYGDTVSFEGLDEIIHEEATMRLLGSNDVVFIPSVDTIIGLSLESDIELIIEQRDLIVSSYQQDSGVLNLTSASIIVEKDFNITGDSLSLQGLDSRVIQVGGDVVLTGSAASPIRINSTLEHTWIVGGSIQADSAQIGNSQLQVSTFGAANNSENLGGNSAWNFSIPTGVELGVDSINEGQASPVFVGLLNAVDSLDDSTNDTYVYTISNTLEDRDNGKFSIREDSLFLNETPDVEVQLDYLLGVRVVDQTGTSAESVIDLRVRDSVLFIAQNITQTSTSEVSTISKDDSQRQFFQTSFSSSDTLSLWIDAPTTLVYELSFDSTETLKDTTFQREGWSLIRENDSTLWIQNQLNQLGLDSVEIDFPLTNGAFFTLQQFVNVVKSPFLSDSLGILQVFFKDRNSFYSPEANSRSRPLEVWIQVERMNDLRSVEVVPEVPVKTSKDWVILEVPVTGEILDIRMISTRLNESNIQIQIPSGPSPSGTVVHLENWHSAQKVYTIEGRQHQGWLNEGFFYVP